LAAKRVLDETNKFWECYSDPRTAHIGIHCGEAEVGIIGPEARKNLTTISPSVNVAARIEGEAFPGQIFLSEKIKEEATISWDGDYVGNIQLKGVKHPLAFYQVRSVGFSSIPKGSLNQSQWVFSTLEAQALGQIGRDMESLELAKKAASSPEALVDLNPELILLPQEICISALLSLNQLNEAEYFIHRFAESASRLSAQLECAKADFYLAESLALQKKYIEAVAAYNKAKQEYEQYGNKRGIADSLFYIGVCFQQMGNSGQASKLFNEAKKEYLDFINYQEAADAEVGKACLELSILLANDLQQVIDILALAIKKFEVSCQYRLLVRALNNMSQVCNRMGTPTNAENYARRALYLAEDFDPVIGVIDALVNIGASIETKCNLGMLSNINLICEALSEARSDYQQASALAYESNRDELGQKIDQYIQRVNKSIQSL
jgi:tetratricopeptide (TPR) repeat protein